MFESLRQPRWLVGAVVALVTIAAFVSLGFWQLGRHEVRKDFNRSASAAIDAPALGFQDVDVNDLAPLEYREVRLQGEFVADALASLQLQSYQGRAGTHVLGAFELGDGAVIVINRGWVGIDDAIPPAPAGAVALTGRLRVFEAEGRVTASGPPIRVSRIDRDLLSGEWGLPLAPFYLESIGVDTDRLPLAVEEPTFGSGPHLTYAGQWFAFAAIVAVGFPLLLRRASRRS